MTAVVWPKQWVDEVARALADNARADWADAEVQASCRDIARVVLVALEAVDALRPPPGG